MELIELTTLQNINQNKGLNYTITRFKELLQDLNNKELSPHVIELINKDIQEINCSPYKEKKLSSLINQKHTKILSLIRKEHKLIPKGNYSTLWAICGMAIFGIPLGVIYGKLMGNIGLIGFGLPVGLGIGIMVGMWLDNKVQKEGRQLNIRA